MNGKIRTGLLLGLTVTAGSACTTLLGGFDFDGKGTSTSGSGGTGGMSGSSGASVTTNGGTGGMTGASVATSTSSTGSGGVTCVDPLADCPAPAHPCQVAQCDSTGKCAIANAGADTRAPIAAQTPRDCNVVVCDGLGNAKTIPDDSDIEDDLQTCTADSCKNGTPIHAPLGPETKCPESGGTKCGDASAPGVCVECNAGTQSTDCASKVCQSNKCVIASCGDTIKNGQETDKDCGGLDCGACADGLICIKNTDCVSLVCNGVCKAPACNDGKANGAETGKDCGNTGVTGCGLCPPGEGCAAPGDCGSGVCNNKICQVPTCSDGAKNQAESDVDCGGSNCPKCGFGLSCAQPTDCATGYCIGGKCDALTVSVGPLGGGFIVVDANNVYWTANNNYGVGSVLKAPISGGAAVPLSTGPDQNDPTGIALDTSTNPTTVFWGEYGAGTINRVSAAGGAKTVLASGDLVSNGPNGPALSEISPAGLAYSNSTVYWADSVSGTVQKVSSTVSGPTTPTQVSTIWSENPNLVTVDLLNVYWTSSASKSSPMVIIGASLATGANKLLYTAGNGPYELSVVSDSLTGKLFFADAHGGKIMSMAKNGTNLATMLVTPWPSSLAISGTTLYWIGVDAVGSTINKMQNDGTGVAVLAAGQSLISSIAVDNVSVYWVNVDGVVKKVNK